LIPPNDNDSTTIDTDTSTGTSSTESLRCDAMRLFDQSTHYVCRTHSRILACTATNRPKLRWYKLFAYCRFSIATDPISIVLVTSPLFSKDNAHNVDDATRKIWTKLLRKTVAYINRKRPKLVVAVGHMDESTRKVLARISETIPTVVHDGSAFFTFWILGVQCIALQAATMIDSESPSSSSLQVQWLREQLEQVRMSKHPFFVFVDAHPNQLDQLVLKKLARGRTLCLFGLAPVVVSTADEPLPTARLESKIKYEANELVDDIQCDPPIQTMTKRTGLP
jgi:hypothetical protein